MNKIHFSQNQTFSSIQSIKCYISEPMYNLKIYKTLSSEVQKTYRFHGAFALFHGVLIGILPMAGFIAQKSLNCTKWELAIIKCMPQAGLLFTIFWSSIAANRPKMPLVFWPGLFSRICLFFTVYAFTSWQFMLIISLSYLLNSMVVPAQNGIMRANYPQNKRGEIVGSIQAIMFTIASLTALGAGRILNWDPSSYGEIFFFVGLAGCISLLFFRKIHVQGEEELEPFQNISDTPFNFPIFHGLLLRVIGGFGASLKDTVRVLKKDITFRKYMVAYFLFGFANLMAMPVYDIFYYKELKADYVQSALILSVIPQILVIATTAYWGKFLDRVNIFHARSLFSLVWMLEPLIYIWARNIEMVYVAKVLAGIAMGGSSLVWLLGAMYFAPKDEVPIYMGIHTTLTGVRGLIAPFVGVALIEILPIRVFFVIPVLLMFASCFLTHRMGKNKGTV